MRRILFHGIIATLALLAPAGVLAGEREDKATAEQIAAVLRDSGKMRGYSVGVKYKNGTVWISGRVTSEQQMQTALQVISDLDGVEQIVNNLEVTSETSATKSSARRVSAVNADLALEAQTAEYQQPSDGNTPVGYHRLASRRSARLAPPVPAYMPGAGGGGNAAAYDQPHLPNYAWPSYAAHPNYAAVTYPKQYSPTAWPFIGPFYPYPQVPLGWRKVALEWDDGWWFLDFYDRSHH